MWIRALTQPRVRTFEDFVLNHKDAGIRAYIWIFFASFYQLPDGNVVGRISRSRQPNFRPDGTALVVNGEGGANENVWEYNVDGSPIRAISASPATTIRSTTLTPTALFMTILSWLSPD